MRRDEVLHGHGRHAGHLGNDLVGAREDAVLIVDRNRAEMLDQKRGQAEFFEALAILGDGEWLIADLSAEHVADGGGDAWLVQLGWAMERVGLTDMRGRLYQDRSDQTCLIFGRDRGMASSAIGEIDDALLDNRLARKRIPEGSALTDGGAAFLATRLFERCEGGTEC
jgi:hypothetical protein